MEFNLSVELIQDLCGARNRNLCLEHIETEELAFLLTRSSLPGIMGALVGTSPHLDIGRGRGQYCQSDPLLPSLCLSSSLRFEQIVESTTSTRIGSKLSRVGGLLLSSCLKGQQKYCFIFQETNSKFLTNMLQKNQERNK